MSDAVGPGQARILEQGYRRFEGARQGQAHAVRSLVAHTLRHVLGLRRPARAKVLPALVITFAYLPATVFVGVVALFGRLGGTDLAVRAVPAYSGYYGFVVSAIVAFVAFTAPEALCPDRRSGVLSLYLASPLTRLTYLAAKAVAVAAVLTAVTVGPLLLLLAGLTLQGAGPDGPVELLRVLARIVGAGLVLTALYTAISMAVASLTDRRAAAAAATLFLLIGSAAVSATLVFGLDGPPELMVLSLTRAPLELARRIHGADPAPRLDVDTVVLAAGAAGWTAVSAAAAVLRYRRLRVTR